jgi:type IV pilus assembly protein PilB
MGIEPYLVSSSVDCVVAQRLIRRLCERCKEPYDVGPAEKNIMGWDVENEGMPDVLHRPKGCGACGKTGYHGRFALHEVLLVGEEMRSMIAERAHADDLKKMAIAQGMLTLRQAGLTHVRMGSTSVEELLRVVA